MSTTDAATWKVLLQHLQVLVDASSDAEASAASLDVLSRLVQQDKRVGNVALARATWKKLVLEMQVPLHVCTAVVKADLPLLELRIQLQEQAQQPQPQQQQEQQQQQQQQRQHQQRSAGLVVATAVITVLEHLLHALTLSQASTATSLPASLLAALRQQIEQSGFLQHYLALLNAVSDMMVRSTDQQVLLMQAAAAPDSPESSTPATSTATTSSSSSQSDAASAVLHRLAERLFRIHWRLYKLWPAGTQQLAVAAASAPQLMHLVLAVLQNISAQVHQQQQPQPELCSDTEAVLAAAYSALGRLFGLVQSVCVGAVLEDDHPHLLTILFADQSFPCMAATFAITTYILRMLSPKDLGFDPAASSTSSSSSSGRAGRSNSKRKAPKQQQEKQPEQQQQQHELAVWQEGCQLLPFVSPCQHRLIELLGLDARVVLWAAAAAQPECCMSALTKCYELRHELLQQVKGSTANGDGSLQQQQQQQEEKLVQLQQQILGQQQQEQGLQLEQQQEPELELEQQLHLLLPALLLSWPAHLAPQQAQSPSFVTECRSPVDASMLAVQSWQFTSQLPKALSDDPYVQQNPPPAVLDEVVPLALTVAAGLAEHMDAAAAAGAIAAASSSSSSWLDSSTRARLAFPFNGNLMVMLTGLLQVSVFHRGISSSTEPAAAAAAADADWLEDDPSSPQRELLCVQGLPKHTCALLECLERLVRHASVGAVPALARLRNMIVSTFSVLTDGSFTPLTVLACGAGPDSPEQRRLYSLACSLAKASHCVHPEHHAGLCISNAANTALALLCGNVYDSPSTAAAAAAAAAAEAVTPSAAPAAPAAAAAGAAAAADEDDDGKFLIAVESLGVVDISPSFEQCDAISVLPSLALFGRCCLLWAQHLQHMTQVLLAVQRSQAGSTVQHCVGQCVALWGMRQAIPPAEFQGFDHLTAAGVCFFQSATAGAFELLAPATALEGHCSTVISWLETDSVQQQLTAKRYDPQQLSDLLQQLLQDRAAAADSTTADAQDRLAALVQRLQEVGWACTAFAVPVFCNNPACSNLGGSSELELVSGRSCQCAGCRTARYCGRVCQKQHWKQHKAVCKALAAGAAAVGADAAA